MERGSRILFDRVLSDELTSGKNTVDMKTKSKSHYDWRSGSLSVCLGVEPPLGLVTGRLFLLDSCCLVYVGRPV
jgi:hypothetical protein